MIDPRRPRCRPPQNPTPCNQQTPRPALFHYVCLILCRTVRSATPSPPVLSCRPFSTPPRLDCSYTSHVVPMCSDRSSCGERSGPPGCSVERTGGAPLPGPNFVHLFLPYYRILKTAIETQAVITSRSDPSQSRACVAAGGSRRPAVALSRRRAREMRWHSCRLSCPCHRSSQLLMRYRVNSQAAPAFSMMALRPNRRQLAGTDAPPHAQACAAIDDRSPGACKRLQRCKRPIAGPRAAPRCNSSCPGAPSPDLCTWPIRQYAGRSA